MNKIIAVDFDGTLDENRWPGIGQPKAHVIERLREEQAAGAKVILRTCRSGEQLEAAVKFCADHGIHPDAVNENLPEILETFDRDCRKIFATEYWDDKAVPIT